MQVPPAFGLGVVKHCSVCPTLCWVRISPVLWWGQKSRPCPPPGRPWEGCMREGCSPSGDAAPFPSALLPAPPALVSLSALLWQRLPASHPKQVSHCEQQLPSTPLLSPTPWQPLRSPLNRMHGPHGRDRTGHLSHPSQPQGAALRDPRSISLKPGRGCRGGGGLGWGLSCGGKGRVCEEPSAFLPARGKHGVWPRMGIKRGFAACAVPGLRNRHRSPELSIWYLSPALKFN